MSSYQPVQQQVYPMQERITTVRQGGGRGGEREGGRCGGGGGGGDRRRKMGREKEGGRGQNRIQDSKKMVFIHEGGSEGVEKCPPCR